MAPQGTLAPAGCQHGRATSGSRPHVVWAAVSWVQGQQHCMGSSIAWAAVHGQQCTDSSIAWTALHGQQWCMGSSAWTQEFCGCSFSWARMAHWHLAAQVPARPRPVACVAQTCCMCCTDVLHALHRHLLGASVALGARSERGQAGTPPLGVASPTGDSLCRGPAAVGATGSVSLGTPEVLGEFGGARHPLAPHGCFGAASPRRLGLGSPLGCPRPG